MSSEHVEMLHQMERCDYRFMAWPDPVLAWARGSVCVFPQDRQDLLWVPERLTRKCNKNEDATQRESTADSSRVPMDDTVSIPESRADTP